ncbi:MAG: DUF1501 domain-containing protein, partial [Planctomycetota bacterium]|nr:DUF1501 domain-containing protein [Planctomycetota bacterium]
MQHRSTCSCSRRHFLRGSGLTLAGFGIASLFPTPLIRQALAGGLDNPDKRLIFIFQRGGNDGINSVIPTGDPDYNTTNRPTLYIPPGSAVDLGNGFAHLHPGLGDLMDLYPGDLAIIHRCGYAGNSRSHFDGQRIWENGDPTQPQMFEGWLYRYIQEHAIDVGVDLPVISVQNTPPLVLRGETKYVNVANPDSFDYIDPDPKRAKYSGAWRDHFSELVGLERYRPVLSQTGVKLADTLDEYRAWDQLNYRPRDPNNATDELFPVDDQTGSQGVAHSKGFSDESWAFFRSLKLCALSLLESVGSTNGTRIAGAQLDGWDLHDNQGQLGGRHEELQSWLAYGIRSLRLALNGAALDNRSYPDIWNDTLVSTMTEFGRTTV